MRVLHLHIVLSQATVLVTLPFCNVNVHVVGVNVLLIFGLNPGSNLFTGSGYSCPVLRTLLTL